MQHHLHVGFRVAQTIDGRDRSDNDDITALHQGLGGGQAHLLDVLVYRCVLFNKAVCGWYISFWLVVIVIRDKKFHGIIGEEFFHFPISCAAKFFIGRGSWSGGYAPQ